VPERSPAGHEAHDAASDLGRLIAARALEAPHATYLVHARTRASVTFAHLDAVRAAWGEVVDPNADLRVGVALSDPLVFAVTLLGVMAAGGTVAPLDPTLPDAALAAACHRLDLALVVADRPPPSPDLVERWRRQPRRGLDLLGTGGVAAVGRARPPSRAPSGRGCSLVGGGVVLATSGTTGTPKVIALTGSQLLHTGRAVAGHHRFGPADVGFSPLPLWHINAEVVGLLATLAGGGRLVLDERFHRRDLWFLLGAHRVSWLNAVPAILARAVPLQPGEMVAPELRFARSASAPLPLPVLHRFEEATGVPVVETYGMTEASSQIAANPIGIGRRPGTVGVPVGIEIRLRSLFASEAPFVSAAVDEAGTVEIRGPGVITDYANGSNPERFGPDGWFATGDIGVLDRDGYLTLLGRTDDVINRGGEKIHPRVVEDVLMDDPALVAVAVVGRPDPDLGQVPVAYLAVAPGTDADVTVERARRACADRLGRGLTPVEFLVVDELPAGATGKVRRAELASRSLLSARR
jgi:oxalate---CoA ligase